MRRSRTARIVLALALALAASAEAQLTPTVGAGFPDPREPEITKKARKQTRFRARTSLGYLLLTEDQATPIGVVGGMMQPLPEARLASPDTIQQLDLRGWYEVSRLRGAGFLSMGDIRLRLAGALPRADELSPVGAPKVIEERDSYGRGQRGGSEIDLRELYVGSGGGKHNTFAGRLIVREADGVTVDGLRYLRKTGPGLRNEYGVYAGLAPDPLSRSLETDYGTDGFRTVLATGATYAYRRKLGYGSFGAGGILGFAKDDGDAVTGGVRSARTNEKPRVFITSNGFFRLGPRWDFFHYLVTDVFAEDGASLRSLHGQFGYRPSLKFHAELGYSHMSTTVLELYLFDLLDAPVMGTVQSNLLVNRVSRDEVRAQLNFSFAERRYDIYTITRGRRRAPDLGADAAFANVSPEYALDLTVGARDRRSFKKLRLGTSITQILDFRASSFIFHLDVGRDFKQDKLAIDASFDYQRTRDEDSSGGMACASNAAAFTRCFGRYSGSIFDTGLTAVYRPSRRWLGLFDYHMLYDNGQSDPAVQSATTAQTPILTHIAFLKAQYSY